MASYPHLTRRRVALAVAAAVGAAGAGTWYWSRMTGDPGPFAAALPPLDATQPASVEVFHALSQLVTCRDDLDPAVTARLFPLFMDEPWGPKHIATAYSRLRAAAISQGTFCPPGAGVDLGAEERWFVEHLLTTWYLGVYYHVDLPTRRMTYEGALMFDAVAGFLPLPLVERVSFGAWAQPPPGASDVR